MLVQRLTPPISATALDLANSVPPGIFTLIAFTPALLLPYSGSVVLRQLWIEEQAARLAARVSAQALTVVPLAIRTGVDLRYSALACIGSLVGGFLDQVLASAFALVSVARRFLQCVVGVIGLGLLVWQRFYEHMVIWVRRRKRHGVLTPPSTRRRGPPMAAISGVALALPANPFAGTSEGAVPSAHQPCFLLVALGGEWDEVLTLTGIPGRQELISLTTSGDGASFQWILLRSRPGCVRAPILTPLAELQEGVRERRAPAGVIEETINWMCKPPDAEELYVLDAASLEAWQREASMIAQSVCMWGLSAEQIAEAGANLVEFPALGARGMPAGGGLAAQVPQPAVRPVPLAGPGSTQQGYGPVVPGGGLAPAVGVVAEPVAAPSVAHLGFPSVDGNLPKESMEGLEAMKREIDEIRKQHYHREEEEKRRKKKKKKKNSDISEDDGRHRNRKGRKKKKESRKDLRSRHRRRRSRSSSRSSSRSRSRSSTGSSTDSYLCWKSKGRNQPVTVSQENRSQGEKFNTVGTSWPSPPDIRAL